MKELYETVLARLSDQVPELQEIDLNMGQLDVLSLDIRPSVLFPCALLDISLPVCEDNDQEEQLVSARVTVRLAFECPLPTDSKASELRRTAALLLFEIVDKVYKAIQGYGTDEFATFSRKSQVPDNRYAGIKIIDMVFETSFIDATAYQT